MKLYLIYRWRCNIFWFTIKIKISTYILDKCHKITILVELYHMYPQLSCNKQSTISHNYGDSHLQENILLVLIFIKDRVDKNCESRQ